MRRARAHDLLFVAKAEKATLETLITGVHLERRTGYAVQELVARATADRLALAALLAKAASQEVAGPVPNFRCGVSRAYYAMYHVFRAVSFYVNQGDDHQEHAKLPGKIPPDFPDHDRWQDDLKAARLARNRADYDPYPRQHERFQAAARDTLKKLSTLLPLARGYLRKKGCRL